MFDVQEQMKIIKKGTVEIINETELEEKIKRSLATGKPLSIKLGLDPTAPDIHLGHTVVLRKIKQLQDLGHEATLIIGDFTGMIGDPTGKSKARKQLSRDEVLENAETYKRQMFKILDPKKTEVCFNSTWLEKLGFKEILEFASRHTVARMLERDAFKQRFNNNQPIGIHEFFYPLMQGFDSVHLKTDIEIGGTDQRFNILMGRTMQSNIGEERQIALFLPLLEGLDGVEKMSKSLGNYVGIHELPSEMYDKIMTLPDSLIIKYFELVTDIHPDTINEYSLQLDQGVNPRDIKMILAKEIVVLYHGETEAHRAQGRFIEIYQKNKVPDDLNEVMVVADDTLLSILAKAFKVSNSEARRLIQQGGVKLNQMKVTDEKYSSFKNGDIIKVGKKRFAKLRIK